MSGDEKFLLYPLDTGDDAPCPACGKTMTVDVIEERGSEPGFISFRCERCGRTEKFICE